MSLFAQHARMLAASGITPEHARARGYVTVDTKVRLERIGITPAGRAVPGLLVPSLRADGSTWGYQYRPDAPRQRNGRAVKYETPSGQRNGLDVPPGVGVLLGDPSVPLWITEGVKKGDAGALAGLCIVALPGVWSWLGSNPKGGKVALPEWRDVALNGRRVILAFDSDVVRKSSVRKALDALARYLGTKGAHVEYLHLPDDEPGKTGLDDYLADGHTAADLLALVRPEPPAVVVDAPVLPSTGSTGSAGSTGSIETPLETGQVLGDVRRWLARFVRTMHDADLDLLTLWAAHTHLVNETYSTPRLVLDSPMHGAGKTTVLEHLQRLTHDSVVMASVSSPAMLARLLDNRLRTILIDEADRTLNPDRDGVAELYAILNSGYKRGATRPVLVPTKDGWEVKEMPTFAPVCMAGNNPNLPEDTRSRTIRVLLLPDLEGRVEESLWEDIDDDASELGARLARWAEQVREQVRTQRPPLPEGVVGRARERWSPLKRVAAAAGGRWPAVVDALSLADLARIQQDREDGMVRDRPAVLLLRDIHLVWIEGETFVPTERLLPALIAQNPNTWGQFSAYGKALTAQRLGRMLVTSYNLHSDRLGGVGPRGYLRATLEPVFRGMGYPPSIEPVRPAEPVEPVDDPTRCGTCGNRLHKGRCVRCLTTAASS